MWLCTRRAIRSSNVDVLHTFTPAQTWGWLCLRSAGRAFVPIGHGRKKTTSSATIAAISWSPIKVWSHLNDVLSGTPEILRTAGRDADVNNKNCCSRGHNLPPCSDWVKIRRGRRRRTPVRLNALYRKFKNHQDILTRYCVPKPRDHVRPAIRSPPCELVSL